MDITSSKSSEIPSEEILRKERDEIAEYIRLWGNSASLTLLDPTCENFGIPSIQGVIGYRQTRNVAVVFGDPVCAPQDKPLLAKAFHDYCQNQNICIVYMTLSESFASWAIQNICNAMMEVGKELIVDPHYDLKKGSAGRVIRRKTNCAQKAGVLVSEYTSYNQELKRKIEEVGTAWLKARKGPQIYFAHVDLVNDDQGKRYFYAMQGEKIVGVILLNKLEIHEGWLLHLLMITPEAPVGTSELLITQVLETLQKENCHYLTFGVSQSEEMGEILGFGGFSSWLARSLFKLAQKMFSLDGRRKFWEKFQPKAERSFLLFSHTKLGLKGIISMIRALNVRL